MGRARPGPYQHEDQIGGRLARSSDAGQAGLIAVGEPIIEEGLDKALTGAANVVKRAVNATTEEITSELQEAL